MAASTAAPDLLQLFNIFQCNRPEMQPRAQVPITVNLVGSVEAIRLLVAFHATVQDVINASLKAFVKIGRLPRDASTPQSYGLHYSQFCLESIHPAEPINRLGARSFLLCPLSSTRQPQFSEASQIFHQACGKGKPWWTLIFVWITQIFSRVG